MLGAGNQSFLTLVDVLNRVLLYREAVPAELSRAALGRFAGEEATEPCHDIMWVGALTDEPLQTTRQHKKDSIVGRSVCQEK